MARKRMIDPSIWGSEDFSRLSTLAKLVFIGLFSNADDEGRGRAKAAYVKSTLFPYDEGMRVIDIDKTLSEIASNVSVTFYLHDENEYYSLDNWHEWQKIDRPTPSKIPALAESSTIIRRVLDESSLPIEKNRKEKEKKKIEKEHADRKAEDFFSDRSFSETLKKSITCWLDYKAERGEKYKATGLKMLLSRIENKLKDWSEDQVILAMTESMARNYQGIIWDLAKQTKYKSKGEVYGGDNSDIDKAKRPTYGTIL